MITLADLQAHTKADLTKMAKRLGLSVGSTMRKDELVAAVAKASRHEKTASSRSSGTKANKGATGGRQANKVQSSKVQSSKAQSSKTQTSTKAEASSKATSSNKAAARSKTTSESRGPIAKPTASRSVQSTSKRLTGAVPDRRHRAPAKQTRVANSASPATSPVSDPASSASQAKKQTPASSPKSKAETSTTAKKPIAKAKPQLPPTNPKVLKKIRQLQHQKESGKDISFRTTLVRPPGAAEPIWEKEPQKDRVALFVRDPHWLHATWDITRNAIERARAAMLEQWHGAKPILRLLRMDDSGTTTTSETIERDIEIHGGLRNWYINWHGEAASFRVLIGYLSANGRFHVIAKSNIVKTASAGASDAVDEHWSDMGAESERVYALSGGYDAELETGELKEVLEDRLHRTLGAPALAKLGANAEGPFRRRSGFHFDMDIELVVFGSTLPDGYLTLNGEPVALRSDGSFVLRLPFPDRRQVLPAVACSRDGSQQRTIVVAVERNTKVMEPLEKEKDTDE